MTDRIDAKEVAAMADVSVDVVYKLTRMKLIPHRKVGGKISYNREHIKAWLDEAEVKPEDIDCGA